MPVVPLDPSLFDLLHQVLRRQVPLLPASLSEVQTLLDVGCGSLPWAKGMVQALSQQGDRGVLDRLHIDSLEITPVVVRAGQQYSRTSRGHIVVRTEEVGHLPATLKGYYDLVHAHLLSPYVAPTDWSQLVAELVGVCKPGGWIVWDEPDLPARTPSTPAWNRLLSWIEQSIQRQGGSLGISQQMEPLLRRAGASGPISTQVTVLALTTASRRLHGWLPADHVDLLKRLLEALRPPLQAAGIVTDQQLEAGLREVLAELRARAVDSRWNWYRVCGRTASSFFTRRRV